MRLGTFVSFLALAALVSCSGLSGLTSEGGDADGVVYHLPQTVLEITVRQYQDPARDYVWYSLGGPSDAADKDPDKSDVPGFNEIKSHEVPDPWHRYVIKYNTSRYSDDRLCISRGPDGLLHDVQFAADDRTPEIVFNIARFVGGFIGDPKGVAFRTERFSNGKRLVRRYTGKVNPYDANDIKAFNSALANIFEPGLKIDFRRLYELSQRAANTIPRACEKKGNCPSKRRPRRCDEKHICYRTKIRLPVNLKLDGRRVDVKYADVVSAWDIGAISVSRAFLVQKITKLRFEKGVLVSAIIRKPSEVEEVTLLPLNVVNAILTVPSGLWSAAFADNDFKNKVIEDLAAQNEKIKGLSQSNSLLLQGSSPAAKADYSLNCSGGKRTDFINLLGDSS